MVNKKYIFYLVSGLLVLAVLRVIELNAPVPAYGKLYTSLGKKHEEKGDTQSALRSYQRATYHNPGYREAYFHLGLLYAALGNEQKKLENFRKVVELGPEWEKINAQTTHSDIKRDEPYGLASYELGADALYNGRVDTAIDYLEKAQEYNGGLMNIYPKLGEAYLIKGEKGKAIEQYQTILNRQYYDDLEKLRRIMERYGVKIRQERGVAYEWTGIQ